MTCETCRFWDIDSIARTPGGRLRRAGARCLWQMPDMALPDAITRNGLWRPTRTHMWAEDGADCPVQEART